MSDRSNELNNIILDGKTNKNRANKRVFVGIATLVLLLIVVVITMGRIMHNGETQLPMAAESSVPSIATPKPAMVPEAEKPAETDAVAEGLTEIPSRGTEAAVPEAAVTEAETVESTSSAPVQDSGIAIIEPTPAPAPEPAPVTVPKPVTVPAPVTVEPAKTARPAVTTPAESSNLYIQVGAFTKLKPNKTFLKKIEQSGLNYTFYEVKINGKTTNKVLVGPFASHDDALHALKKVKREIEPGAFLYRMK